MISYANWHIPGTSEESSCLIDDVTPGNAEIKMASSESASEFNTSDDTSDDDNATDTDLTNTEENDKRNCSSSDEELIGPYLYEPESVDDGKQQTETSQAPQTTGLINRLLAIVDLLEKW